MSETALSLVIAIITSSAFTAVVQRLMSKKDDVRELMNRCDKLMKKTDVQADALAMLAENLLTMVDALHKKGVLNGESEHVRQSIVRYLLSCTEDTFYLQKNQKK